jgi:hypothetical protein
MIPKIFKYLAVLIITIMIADRVIYFCIDKIQAKTLTGESGGKINAYLHLQKPPELLIMGHSSATYQINPSSFSIDAYNIGHANTKDAFQAGLLSVIIESNKKPKYIMLHVLPDSYLDEDTTSNFVNDDILKLKFFYKKNKQVTDYINEIGIKEQIKFSMHLSRYNNRVINTIKNYFTTKKYGAVLKGFEPLPVSERDSIVATINYNDRKQVINKPNITKVIQKAKMRYLKDIVSLCNANKIKLILFTLPNYIQVKDGFVDDLATQNINAFSKENGIKYFDFRKGDLSNLINRAIYWKDGNHLNAIGATIESTFVSEEVSATLLLK